MTNGGYQVRYLVRSAGKAEPLLAKGAVLAETAADAVAASELVVLCLLEDRSVRDVLDVSAAALSGRVVANLTNGTPRQARELAAWVAERGADFLDGGIMAIPPTIGQPGAFVFYSGSRRAFDSHREAFDTFGESRYVGTDPGLAALQDLALLSGMYGLFIGVLQAFALVGSEGVKTTEFAPLLTGWLNSVSGFIGRSAEQIDRGDYKIGVVSNLGMQAAAYGNLFEVAEDQGLSAELLAPLKPLLDKRVADGHGAEDITSVIELLKK